MNGDRVNELLMGTIIKKVDIGVTKGVLSQWLEIHTTTGHVLLMVHGEDGDTVTLTQPVDWHGQ